MSAAVFVVVPVCAGACESASKRIEQNHPQSSHVQCWESALSLISSKHLSRRLPEGS